LAGPLSGMGIAFSSSLFGLAGSLILGFLDLQAGHAQSRFYNELEDWLANVTELQTTDPGDSVPPQLRYALMDMQRSISDLGERMDKGGSTEAAVQDLSQGVDKLIRQMRAEQKVVREWADEQAQQQQEIATVLREVASKPKASAGR
ncbi:MAG: flagellar motor protein MotA, partial [Methyloceanibacter sp.]